jgi:spore germination cell wall hydrolase CwlJ-like protein
MMMDAPALALVYALHLTSGPPPADLVCLAEAVYYEAKTQTVKGQLAVAQVVLNRRKSPAFPQSICAVVYQRTGARCQFSWVCNARTLRQAKDPLQWVVAQEIARFAIMGKLPDPTRGATYFHASYVHPHWPHLQKTIKIGSHIFYRPRKQTG